MRQLCAAEQFGSSMQAIPLLKMITKKDTIPCTRIAPDRIIRSAREIWLTIFYSVYRLIVAGVERKRPWDLIPTIKKRTSHKREGAAPQKLE